LLQVSKPTVTAAIEGTGAYENGLVRVARLSAEQVLDIRVAAASGRTLTQVATDFHVARSTVKKVVQKKWPYTEGRLL